MPNHFTLTFFLLRRRDVSCSHSNRDLFTCEDNMLFSHVKISCFRTKAHLVFHWYLYNKQMYDILNIKVELQFNEVPLKGPGKFKFVILRFWSKQFNGLDWRISLFVISRTLSLRFMHTCQLLQIDLYKLRSVQCRSSRMSIILD